MTRLRGILLFLAVAILLPAMLAACGKTIGDTIDDATITTRVKSALLNDPGVNATRIDVATSAGVVTLTGAVKSKTEEGRAVEVARQVPGVREVKSSLQVQQGLASPPTESAH